MPSVSKKQHAAMEAAAHGKSTLGIPKSVGEDFSNADKGKKFAGGGPITAASIESGADVNNFNMTGTQIGNPTPSSSPEIKPISTTDTPPGGGGRPPSSNGGFNPIVAGGGGWGGGGGGLEGTPNPGGLIAGGGAEGSWGLALKDGGMVPPPTTGVSSAYPPPPGKRKEGPRNYGKKE